MYAEIKGAMDAAKVVYDIAKAAKDLQGHAELLSAVTVVQERLQATLMANLELLEKQAKLQTRLEEVERALAKSDAIAALRDQYRLDKVHGGLVMTPVQPQTEGQPVRYLCVTCFEQERVSTLQQMGPFLVCATCNIKFRLTAPPAITPTVRTSTPWARNW